MSSIMLNMCALRTFWGRNNIIRHLPSIANRSNFVAVDSDIDRALKKTKNTGLVAAAFDSLKNDNIEINTEETVNKKFFNVKEAIQSPSEIKRKISDQISAATDVSTLLTLAEKGLSRTDALKIISVLSEWSSSKKVKISEFENDARFISMCQYLGRRLPKSDSKDFFSQISDDLNTVLGVTGDDEAARLITSLNIPQMVKVMSILAQKGRRSTPLLRALSYNISRHADIIDLKKCADLLYAMALLNFPDPVLMDRICSDVQENILKHVDKSSIIGSITTSLGILKYKDAKLLDSLIEWTIQNKNICRTQDVASLIITLGTLGHLSINELNIQKLSQADFTKPSTYLDYVWSLLVLNKISADDLSNVLDEKFIKDLKVNGEITFSNLKKLCNINGYANTIDNKYKGPFLPNSIIESLQITYSKEKLQHVNIMLDTLKSLISSETNIKKNCDSKMGFLFDGEIILDEKCNPYPTNTDIKNMDKRLTKVALFALEYHDLCRNSSDPLGTIILYKRLLEAHNYKVVFLPHTELKSQEKLMHRVQYIEKKLKESVA